MVDVHKNRNRGRWISRIAIGVLLVAAVGLGVWFGMGQPRLWQPPLAASPSPTADVAIIVTPTVSSPPSPLVTPFPENQPAVRVADGTFTSREVVTTTLAVPVTGWTNGAARSVALSADGRWVAFTAPTLLTSTASLTTTTSERGDDDLYLYDRTTGALTRVTTAPDSTPSNGWVGAPAMVPDGRYLAFYAWATNLVAGDTNAVQDLFFYDREQGMLTRISVAANGGQANGRSGDSRGEVAPALSADGRYVAFHSAASNLTSGDANGYVDVFLYDRETNSTTLISQGPLSQGQDGAAGNGDSTHPALSVDGRWVAFASRATNLDPSVPRLEAPGATQIYLHDRTDGSTVLISRGPDGRPGNGESGTPALAGDGRYLVYASHASNLVAGDTNGVEDIFLFDRTTGETRRVSVSSTGIQANRGASYPQITLDGRYVLFHALASNLTYGDGNNVADLFVHDQQARHTSRVSVAVRGAWTAQEANGPTTGQAAIIPGGRLIAFISQATNLTPADAVGVPGLFLHERVDAPTFTLAGRVAEGGGQPVAGVVVAAGPHRTMTDANGAYQLTSLMGGTYTLAVAKAGYTFTPPRRTISLLRDLNEQDFVAFAGSGPDTFLNLPLPYDGSAATLMALLRDTDEGGWIDTWFDHDAPNYTKNESMLLWDGRWRTQDPYNATLGCFERRCYDGHDGIDFPYRDPNPATPNIFEPLLVRPAAAGVVAATVQGCDSGNSDDTRWCNEGYGNEVVLWHENGYFTRYSHLATVTVADGGQWVTPEFALGEMGSTGNSFGTHLHFAVHVDNGNGVWDGEEVDLPVDPFGWAGVEADPWASRAGGPTSRWLWRFNPSTEAILLGSEGATLRDGAGSVTARIPAGALAGQVRVELVTGAAVAPPAAAQRSLGRGFRLQVLDWLQGGTAPNAAPARPVELSVGFDGANLRHLDVEQLLLYHWQAESGWSPLPTVVDSEVRAVIAASNQFGDFDLQAPLLCPADGLEPDDSFDAAVFTSGTTTSWERLFDVAEDEDWFQIEAGAGVSYQVQVARVGAGVTLVTELYDRDGLTRLDVLQGDGTLTLTPVQAGSYFVRVAPGAGSSAGCDATYRVVITFPGN